MKIEGNLSTDHLENLEQGFLGQEARRREIIEIAPDDPISNHSRSKSILFHEGRFMMDVFWLFLKAFSMNRPITLKEFIDRVERTMIVSVLSRVNGNQKKAAKILGIRYTTLNEKVKRYKIRFQKHPI